MVEVIHSGVVFENLGIMQCNLKSMTISLDLDTRPVAGLIVRGVHVKNMWGQ